MIAWALDHRFMMVALPAGSFVAAIAMIATGVGGADFIPVSDRSEINMIIEATPGANRDYTRRTGEAAAAIARRHPEVAYTYTTVGTSVPGKAPSVDQALVNPGRSSGESRSRPRCRNRRGAGWTRK